MIQALTERYFRIDQLKNGINFKTKIIFISCSYRTAASAIWEIFSEFLKFCNLFHES